ncbi:MAG: hypothetical protein GXZ08_08295 [Tissierellia bacterium]|nr:hypothetical protein [Tissierellia bacterium]
MTKGIMIASFGTSYEETRKLCIEAIEQDIANEFADYYTHRAFTSRMIIKKLKNRDGLYIDNEVEALVKMKEEGIENIFIQPLHIIPGLEYEKITSLQGAKISKPLLYDETDYDEVVNNLPLGISQDEALVFMGHGSEHNADSAYERLENKYREAGIENVFIATVEGSRTLEDLIPELKSKGFNKVVLRAFMIVAGDHAQNDMASDEEDSWKTILASEGFDVEVRLVGLGEYQEIRNIFLRHLNETIGEQQ